MNIESIIQSKNMTMEEFILFCKTHTNKEIEDCFCIYYYKLRDIAIKSGVDIKRTGRENA